LQDSFVRWLLFASPYLRIGEFVLGALIAQLYVGLQSHKVSKAENAIGSVVLVAAVISVALITYENYSNDVGINIFRRTNMNFALAPTAGLMIFCSARYRNPICRMLASRPTIALGDASYSIYLTHPVILGAAVKLSGSSVHSLTYDIIKLFVLIAAVIIVSLLLYWYYEAPSRKWLRQLRGSSRPHPALKKVSQLPASRG
jgi:peptidoglycan/LPS O-acetylase OafA/YrhL